MEEVSVVMVEHPEMMVRMEQFPVVEVVVQVIIPQVAEMGQKVR